MWDFIGRTLAMLLAIPPATTAAAPYTDVISRLVMAKELLLDSKPGMLDMMIDSTYPGQTGPKPEIGDDLKEAARAL